MLKRHLIVVVLACLTALSAGCASQVSAAPEAVAQTFVGAVEGSETYVALQLGADGTAQAYLCDSSSVAQVLRGESGPDGTVALTGDQDVGLSGRVDGGTTTGTVTTDGIERPFTAELAVGDAGFYRAQGDDLVVGWVLLNDGTQRGSITILADISLDRPVVKRAPRLDPRTPRFTVPEGGATFDATQVKEFLPPDPTS